jgi:hypothetical protein
VEEFSQDVPPESSTGTEAQADPSQATSPPVQPAEQTIPYSRFQQFTAQRRAERDAWEREKQWYQNQLQARQQPAEPAMPSRPPDPQMAQALDALGQIFEADPQRATAMLSKLLGVDVAQLKQLMQAAPLLANGYQSVQQLTQAHQTALANQAQGIVQHYAQQNNITDPDFVNEIEHFIIGKIQSTPQAIAALKAGDPRPIAWALAEFDKKVAAGYRRSAATATATTKNKVTGLPPRAAGGLPGASVPPKLEPGKARQFEENMWARVRQGLAAADAG